MKILAILLVVIFVGGLALLFANNQSIQLTVGDKAPDFSLKDQDGKVRKLSDYTGERLIVYFFPKADTPGWTKEACGFRDIYGEYKRAKIKVLGISYDSPRALKKFKKKWKLPFNLLSDSKKEVAVKYGANSSLWTKRITFVIDEKGKIEKIYRKMNVNTHAEKILSEITQKK